MKTLIEMARQAGLDVHRQWNDDGTNRLERLVELACADEREACAKLCDARYMGDNNREDMEAKRCAEAIRARGTK